MLQIIYPQSSRPLQSAAHEDRNKIYALQLILRCMHELESIHRPRLKVESAREPEGQTLNMHFSRVVSWVLIALSVTCPSTESFSRPSQCYRRCVLYRRSGQSSEEMITRRMAAETSEASDLENGTGNDTETVEDPPQQKILSPYQNAVKNYQTQLEKEIEYLQSVLTCERNMLALRKDTISMSGRNGYFFVQAEVAEFQKKKEIQQRNRVIKNKREFVEKMLPVVDAFRMAPIICPSVSERENNMHTNFGSLCKMILEVFEKYGFKELHAEAGEQLLLDQHEVMDFFDGEVEGVIINELRPGLLDKDGLIVRRALVSATKGEYKLPVYVFSPDIGISETESDNGIL